MYIVQCSVFMIQNVPAEHMQVQVTQPIIVNLSINNLKRATHLGISSHDGLDLIFYQSKEYSLAWVTLKQDHQYGDHEQKRKNYGRQIKRIHGLTC